MRVAVYARVSTKPQELDLQLQELRAHISARGWTLAFPPFQEKVSSAAEHREKFQQMMKAARRRDFDILLVWRYDRFARTVLELVSALEEFRALDIEFVSLKDGVDTSTPTGKLLFTMLAGIAEFNRRLTCENVSAGLAAAKEKLKTGPYNRLRDGKIITVRALGRPRVPVDLAMIVALRVSGLSWREIADRTGLGQGTVRRAYSALPKAAQKPCL